MTTSSKCDDLFGHLFSEDFNIMNISELLTPPNEEIEVPVGGQIVNYASRGGIVSETPSDEKEAQHLDDLNGLLFSHSSPPDGNDQNIPLISMETSKNSPFLPDLFSDIIFMSSPLKSLNSENCDPFTGYSDSPRPPPSSSTNTMHALLPLIEPTVTAAVTSNCDVTSTISACTNRRSTRAALQDISNYAQASQTTMAQTLKKVKTIKTKTTSTTTVKKKCSAPPPRRKKSSKKPSLTSLSYTNTSSSRSSSTATTTPRPESNEEAADKSDDGTIDIKSQQRLVRMVNFEDGTVAMVPPYLLKLPKLVTSKKKRGPKECTHEISNDLGYLKNGGYAMTCAICQLTLRICLDCHYWTSYTNFDRHFKESGCKCTHPGKLETFETYGLKQYQFKEQENESRASKKLTKVTSLVSDGKKNESLKKRLKASSFL